MMTPAEILIEQATLRGKIIVVAEKIAETPISDDREVVEIPKARILELQELFVQLTS